MLRLTTCRAGLCEEALNKSVKMSLRNEGYVFVIVPKQLTLYTELSLIRALEPMGSMRISVLSPERLCKRIFDTAGCNSFELIDDRGRTMLAGRALRSLKDDLKVYSGAVDRHGFSQKTARQLELFRQAGMTPEELFELSDDEYGLFSDKLRDMGVVLEKYLGLIEGKYFDGESELLTAAERAKKSDIINCAGMVFFGFDIMPKPLHELISALAAEREVNLIMATELNMQRPAFLPVNRSIARLRKELKLKGASIEYEKYAGEDTVKDIVKGDIGHLYNNLFEVRPALFEGAPESVSIVRAADEKSEAMYIASEMKRLAMSGERYNDMAILVNDIDSSRRFIEDAFDTQGVPVFMSSSRSAARHALIEALLTSLMLIRRGYRQDDMTAYIKSGYAPITDDESDILANYIKKYGPTGRKMTNPFTRGGEDAINAEPAREKAIKPIEELRAGLRASKTVRDELVSIVNFLENIDAYRKSQSRINALMEKNLYRLAGEEAQVWDRLMSTLDQAANLLGEKKLSIEELTAALRESLDTAVIKPLPQSADAVSAQSADKAMNRRAKFVFIMGLTDSVVSGGEGLLSDYHMNRLSSMSGKYLGSDANEMSLMKRYSVKTAIGSTGERITFSYAIAGSDGSARKKSMIVSEIMNIMPEIVEISAEENTGLYSVNAVTKNLGRLKDTDTGKRALSTLISMNLPEVNRLVSALDVKAASSSVSRDIAERVYGYIEKASVTRLEMFEKCPFMHFMNYALEPEKIEPYTLTARDEGGFFHDAVRAFLSGTSDIGSLTPDDADRLMDTVTETLIDTVDFDTAVTRAEKRRLMATARAAAEAITYQLRDSGFVPVELEVSFGASDEDKIELKVDGKPCVLEGRVDRVDEWRGADDFVRVIDYKRGGTQLKLSDVYYGLQLQLITYLVSAMRRRASKGAGVYYFRVQEGLIATQSTDEAEVSEMRRDLMRLRGLSTDDMDALRAMSQNVTDVLTVKINRDGTISKLSDVVDEVGMNALIDKTLDNAAKAVTEIRSGNAAVSPARTRTLNPCEYCDHRAACLFDETVGLGRVRKFAEMKNSDVIEALIRDKGAR